VINRTILHDLEQWVRSPERKPLILRGARQVGKTTAVRMFSRRFVQFLAFDLERKEDRDLFEADLPFDTLVRALFFARNGVRTEPSTLIFIDEIQNSEKAIASLRFFHEQAPEIAVIAAGSLLEVMIETHRASFPVGRVEYLYVHPLTFREFLGARGEVAAREAYDSVPLPEFAHAALLTLFHEYVLLGGMPEVVQHRVERDDLSGTATIFDSLITSYIDDAGKYARGRTSFQVLRHVIETAAFESGLRIRFHGFGNSAYRSREVGEAFRTLERAMVLHLLYPVTSTELPLIPDRKRAPRLQFLDVGLMNYKAGLQTGILGVKDLNDLYRGRIAEQIVGQELMAVSSRRLDPPLFWVREKNQSQAEVDFLAVVDGRPVPVEVKSGSSGRLRSLHQYITRSGSQLAVRLYAGPFRVDRLRTPDDSPFLLLSLPHFLAAQVGRYVQWVAEDR
jgi:uncharacterized protein